MLPSASVGDPAGPGTLPPEHPIRLLGSPSPRYFLSACYRVPSTSYALAIDCLASPLRLPQHACRWV
eukprot:542011-Rhodomonas_salina.1